MLDAYAAHLLSLAPVTGRRLKVVVDAGNGMAGLTAPVVFDRIGDAVDAGADVLRARRHLPATTRPTRSSRRTSSTCRSASSRRAPTSGSPSTATPTAASSSTSAATPSSPSHADRADRRARAGQGAGLHGDPQPDHQPLRPRAGHASSAARPVRTRVGHSFIKATMAETDAVFGGEHSGHFYFRDFWRADSGMLAALHTLAALAETDRPLSRAARRLPALPPQRRDQLRGRRPGRRHGRGRGGVRRDARAPTVDHLDGLTVTTPTGGSTSARPTPSRCCASTSRAPTRPPWPVSATTSSP